MNKSSIKWLQLALINFVVVAILGVTLRYKVTFPLPSIEFENLLHSHSHFAFAGWISMALFALLYGMFTSEGHHAQNKFRWLFVLSQVTAYGMMISFLVQEYGAVSNGFSTFYVFLTYGMSYMLWKNSSGEKNTMSLKAMRASLVFLCLSSIGPFALAYIKAAHIMSGELYHNAVYWYLHFQYNGWFSFAVFALFLRSRENAGINTNAYLVPFRLLLLACIPAYFLSVLWTDPPLWFFIGGGAGGVLQIIALVLIIRQWLGERKGTTRNIGVDISTLLTLSAISFSIKIVLQFLAVFPVLNQFVFGHRPVIIGYLHLVMLGFVSFFILGIALQHKFLRFKSATAKTGVRILISGVLLNEAGLMLQGFSGILYTPFKWVPILLFIASLIMFVGVGLLTVSQWHAGLGHWIIRLRKKAESH